MKLSLDDDGGQLKISVTITSFSSLEPASTDGSGAGEGGSIGNSIKPEKENYFAVANTFKKMQEVGRLNVHVIKAEG